MKDRNEEKRVPSSYLEILASTPSRMATNWEMKQRAGFINTLGAKQVDESAAGLAFIVSSNAGM